MTTVPPARAIGWRPFVRLTRIEGTLFARSAASVVWTALLPIAAVVVLGVLPAARRPREAFGGLSPLAAYLPIIMMYVFTMAAVNLLPPVLAGYRERGVLRRFATTPVPPGRLLGAQALIYLAVGVVVDLVLLVVAVACGVPAPRQSVGFVLSLLLVAAATTAIGLLLTALAGSERVANALGMVVFFPLIFFAGMWIPRPAMSPTLRAISDYSPLGAGVRAVQDSLDGHWPAVSALAVLVGYTAVCGAIAARRFRWQ